MDALEPEDSWHCGHIFALPRVSTSVCPGCGQTWGMTISHRRQCGERGGDRFAGTSLMPIVAVGAVAIGSIQKPIARRRLFGWLSDAKKSG